jgi:hypothetical protein
MKRWAIMLGICILANIMSADGSQKTGFLRGIYQQGKIKLSEIQKIQIDSLPDRITLKYPAGIAFNSKGELFVSDITAHNVKIFDAKGNFVRTFGQQGKGPGDLNAPSHIAFNGTYIIVWEIFNRRFSLFTENGEFVRMVKPTQTASVKKIRPLKNGSIMVETEKFNFGKPMTQSCVITAYTKELKEPEVLYQHPLKTFKDISRPKPLTIPLPFPPRVSWDIFSNGRVVIGFQEKYRIGIYDIHKGKLSDFQHDYQPVKVTAKDKEAFFAGIAIADSRSSIKKGAPDFVVKNTTFPRCKPAFYDILVDPEDHILIFPNTPNPGNDQIKADVFDARGKFINRVIFLGKLGYQTVFADDLELWTIIFNDGEWCITKYKFAKA